MSISLGLAIGSWALTAETSVPGPHKPCCFINGVLHLAFGQCILLCKANKKRHLKGLLEGNGLESLQNRDGHTLGESCTFQMHDKIEHDETALKPKIPGLAVHIQKA